MSTGTLIPARSLLARVAPRSFLRVLSLLVAAGIASRSIAAQTGQGTIRGKVTDSSGAVVTGATVKVINSSTRASQATNSNRSGQYDFVSLNPAIYSLEVHSHGFENTVVTGVLLEAAGTATVDVTLKIGQDNISVTVTADDIMLTKDASDVSTTVDHSLVESLPYPERSSLEAALLVPGVVGDAVFPGGIQSENASITSEARATGADISIGGAAPGTSSIMVDGSDVTQGSYPRAGVNLSGQLVQETTVITGGLSAKYGRTSGGSIVQSSRGGTESFHGSVSWRHTDPFFQAVPVGGTIGPDRHEQFYGFYLGGPLALPKTRLRLKNTFFYVGVEPARLRYAVGVRGTFFTPDDLAGHLNNTLALLDQNVLKTSGYAAALAAPRVGSLYYQSPVNAGGFPTGARYGNSGLYQAILNNDVSAQLSQNPFAKYTLSQMPTPANPGPYTRFDNPQGTYQPDGTNGSYQRGVTNTDNRYSIRVDHQFGSRDAIFARFTSIPVTSVRFFALDPNNPLTSVNTDNAYAYNVATGWTHVFSGSIVSSAHYSFLRVNQVRGAPPATLSKDYAASYGLSPATAGYGFPALGSFSVSGVSYSLAPGTAGAGTQLDENFIFGDDVTWTHGRHLFQFGADLRWIQSNQYNNGGVTGGSYSFPQTLTNNGTAGGAPLGTFILGLIGTYTASPIQVPGYYRWRYDAGYFQDDWRILDKLTLNLGLRYNVETPRMEKFGNQPIFIPKTAQGTLNGLPVSSAYCFSNGCAGVGKTLWPIDWLEFEPRVGLAWSPTRKTSIRAAYSLSHLPLTGFTNLPLPDLTGTPTIGGTTGGATANQPVDYITNPVTSLYSYFQTLKGNRGPLYYSNGLAPLYVPQNKKAPYTQNWNFTIQYQVAKQTLLQVTYQGLKGTNLLAPVNASQYGDQNVPSIATVTAEVQAHASLSRVLAQCTGGATTACGNAYQIPTSPMNSTLLQETELQALSPYQNFFNQAIPIAFNRDGASSYNGLLLSVQHRYGHNLSILGNYSWTKILDNVAETTNATNTLNGLSTPPQNPFDLRRERSLASFDQPNRFNLGYNFVLPIGPGQRFHTGSRLLNNLIGELSTSGILRVQSGFPNYVLLGSTGYFTSVTPSGVDGCTTAYCTATALPTGYQLRPNRVPGVPLINKNWKHGGGGVFSSTFVPYLNPAAFSIPGSPNAPALGNLPRTLGDGRSPREMFFDARVLKGFALHENKYHLNITGTFNNAFNHVVYYGLNQASKSLYTTQTVSTTTGQFASPVQAAAFGQMTNNSGNVSRVIRVGAEFVF